MEGGAGVPYRHRRTLEETVQPRLGHAGPLPRTPAHSESFWSLSLLPFHICQVNSGPVWGLCGAWPWEALGFFCCLKTTLQLSRGVCLATDPKQQGEVTMD